MEVEEEEARAGAAGDVGGYLDVLPLVLLSTQRRLESRAALTPPPHTLSSSPGKQPAVLRESLGGVDMLPCALPLCQLCVHGQSERHASNDATPRIAPVASAASEWQEAQCTREWEKAEWTKAQSFHIYIQRSLLALSAPNGPPQREYG